MCRPGGDSSDGVGDGVVSDKTGGPAFPAPEAAHPNAFPPDCPKGMTLLDHFAGLAMQGYLSSIGIVGGRAPTDDDIARYSYQIAATMLDARQDYLEGDHD
jgi:hypothetical protein